ncbi:hypothetical protein C7M84_004500 [Penaeus vannamei]|uniref:Uncharacterized protein n=1 Tax=Penaeus vannamei TaxID=6689 RepID=A0A423TKC2_PENVA|nr:hypothetical protein C7M84_004500 [Penaeus vannamei]
MLSGGSKGESRKSHQQQQSNVASTKHPAESVQPAISKGASKGESTGRVQSLKVTLGPSGSKVSSVSEDIKVDDAEKSELKNILITDMPLGMAQSLVHSLAGIGAITGMPGLSSLGPSGLEGLGAAAG